MRGDIYELRRPKQAMGHEQDGKRYCVVVQSDDLTLSTLLVCPTSTSAPARSWRPEIDVHGTSTLVLTEQVAAVAMERLGRLVGHVGLADMQAIDRALLTVMGMR